MAYFWIMALYVVLLLCIYPHFSLASSFMRISLYHPFGTCDRKSSSASHDDMRCQIFLLGVRSCSKKSQSDSLLVSRNDPMNLISSVLCLLCLRDHPRLCILNRPGSSPSLSASPTGWTTSQPDPPDGAFILPRSIHAPFQRIMPQTALVYCKRKAE